MSDHTFITRPEAILTGSRRTLGGTTVLEFEGFEPIRTTRAYQYLVVELYVSVAGHRTATIVKGTASYKTAETAVRKHSGYRGVTAVLVEAVGTPPHVSFRVVSR